MSARGSGGPTPAQVARFGHTVVSLDAGQRIGVAVSGGPDSLALLLLATAWRRDAVVAATVDHGLRPEAAEEARLVAEVARSLRVPHWVLPVVLDGQGSRQAAARTARYAALERWANDCGVTAIATAHHADDQAETILMRLARGSGVSGLAGVRSRRVLPAGGVIVRPLLAWRRAELAAIVGAAGLHAVDDPSNRDPRYDRTRVRALLAGGWAEVPRLAAAAANLADADEAIDWAADAEFGRRATVGNERLSLDPNDLPDELLRRLVARTLRLIDDGAESIAGPELTRMIERLRGGDHATLGRVKAAPGPLWRFSRAGPHLS